MAWSPYLYILACSLSPEDTEKPTHETDARSSGRGGTVETHTAMLQPHRTIREGIATPLPCPSAHRKGAPGWRPSWWEPEGEAPTSRPPPTPQPRLRQQLSLQVTDRRALNSCPGPAATWQGWHTCPLLPASPRVTFWGSGLRCQNGKTRSISFWSVD